MRRYGTTNLLAVAVVGLATLIGASQAKAGFTITLDTVGGAGPFTWSYRAQINAGDEIRTGDFFRIYDFYGYVPGSIVAPAGWTASVALLNPTPPPNVLVPLGDDAAVFNLIWTYTGTATIAGPTTLFGFSAQSLYSASSNNQKNYVGRNTQASGPNAGQAVDVVGNVTVPNVPEPTSMISLGLGIVALGFYARRKATS